MAGSAWGGEKDKFREILHFAGDCGETRMRDLPSTYLAPTWLARGNNWPGRDTKW
jgi:hypothetical protein